MKLQKVARQAGFTLVEIAIVLVIIGLLLVGVLQGQEMIENTKTKSIVNDMKAIQAVASNTASTVVGNASLALAATLEVGKVVALDAPLLMAGSGSNIVIQIENAKGLGIDLEKLNAGQGVLFEVGLSFEVVSIETIKGQMVYTLKALIN